MARGRRRGRVRRARRVCRARRVAARRRRAGGYHGGAPPARAAVTSAAATTSAAAPARHVVIVGISGLTWNLVTPSAMPALWRLAGAGSVGSLVDYAQRPVACPADGWLTLNSAARAQGPRPCDTLPAVVGAGGGARSRRCPRSSGPTSPTTSRRPGACSARSRPARPPSVPGPHSPSPPRLARSRLTCRPPRTCRRRCWPAAR